MYTFGSHCSIEDINTEAINLTVHLQQHQLGCAMLHFLTSVPKQGNDTFHPLCDILQVKTQLQLPTF